MSSIFLFMVKKRFDRVLIKQTDKKKGSKTTDEKLASALREILENFITIT